MRRSLSQLAHCILVLSVAGPVSAGTYPSREEALAQAFHDTTAVERRTRILTKETVALIEKRAQARLPSRIVSCYVGRPRDDGPDSLRYVFFETETIRTLPALLMVAVSASGAVEFVEMLAFHEPEDYLPPGRWLDHYDGMSLEEPRRVGHDIPTISGSTLSVRGIDRVIRRVLAIWEFVGKEDGDP